MRESQPLAHQQINHTAERCHRQQFGNHRRIINAEIADFGMTDKFFLGIAARFNLDISAFHIIINPQHFQRRSGIVTVNGKQKFLIGARNIIEF